MPSGNDLAAEHPAVTPGRKTGIAAAEVSWHLAVVVLGIVVFAWAYMTFYRTVPVERPWVEVMTTRCVRPDGMPVEGEFGQPCPPGTTQEAVAIQSYLP